MVIDKTVVLMEGFLSGRLGIDEFEQRLGDELFELRQDGAVTEERRSLARAQLFLHEFREGNRDVIEVYMAAQAALDLARPFATPPRSKIDMDVPPSQPGEVVPGSSCLQPDFSEVRTPIPV